MKIKMDLSSFLLLFTAISMVTAQTALGAGVTIITHGFQPVQGFTGRPVWVDGMGNQIAHIANRSRGNAAVYEMEVDGFFPPRVTSFTKSKGLSPSDDPNSEVIIKLYWNRVADSFGAVHADTPQIAQAVVPFLTNPNVIPTLPKANAVKK